MIPVRAIRCVHCPRPVHPVRGGAYCEVHTPLDLTGGVSPSDSSGGAGLMDTSRAGRRERRRPGYCTNCYARPASQGKRTCAHCLAYRRSVRAERRAGWQCVICSADTEPCRKHCPACLDAMARREAGRRPEPTRVLRCSLCGGERHNAATCARRAAS